MTVEDYYHFIWIRQYFITETASQLYTNPEMDQNRRLGEDRHRYRSGFLRLMDFVLEQPHAFIIPGFDANRGRYAQGRLTDEAFAQIEPWLTEHCPSFTRLGPLLGIQDDDEAFLFKMQFG